MVNQAGDARSPHLLVIDAHAEFREALALLLKGKGFRVSVATDSQDARRLLTEYRNDFDLIMLDPFPLPDLEENQFRVPVILLISEDNDLYLSNLYSDHVEAVFTKPFNYKRLLRAIDRGLELKSFSNGKGTAHRRQSRVEVKIPITIHFQGMKHATEGLITNFSAGGCFVMIPDLSLEVGMRCKFNILVQSPWLVQITGEGIVRWHMPGSAGQGGGCGIEFVNLSDSTKVRLLELVNYFKLS